MHTDANASVTDDLSEGDSSHQPHLAAVPRGPITTTPPSLGGLPMELQQEIVTAILDSGAGLCTLSEELVRRKGLQLVPSSHLARLGDGTIVKSAGSADVVFLFQTTSVLSESCKIKLNALGFNDRLLISRSVLASSGFRFFDSDPNEYGSFIITPSWHWFPLKLEGGATICDFQMSVQDNKILLKPISDIDPIHADLSSALNSLLTLSCQDSPTNSGVGVLHGAAAEVFNSEMAILSSSADYMSSESIHDCVMTHIEPIPCCSLALSPVFNLSTAAVARGLRSFSKQQLHEVFGHCSDVSLDNILDKHDLENNPDKTSRKKRQKCRCASCLRGFHPSRRVSGVTKNPSPGQRFETGQCWNFDFGRYWSDPDIEGFRTDATFVEYHSRYAFVVLLKDHTCLWEAIEELRRFVREKLQLEVTHLHCDSDPMLRVNGSPSET